MNYRKVRVLTVLSGVVLWLAAAVQAQIAPHSLKVNVPFEFSVNDQWFPAGQYVLECTVNQVQLRDARSHVLALIIPHSVESLNGTGTPGLVFARAGGGYILRQVWAQDSHYGYEVPASKTAAILARQRSNPPVQMGTGGNK